VNTGSENRELLELIARAADRARDGITIADMRLPDEPLIYVNDGFTRLTGYTREEILGRNCRFLQGGQADPATVTAIREAIRSGREIDVELKNCRKDGAVFWNRLSLTPLRDTTGNVTHYVGVQTDVTDRVEARQALEDALLRYEALQVAMARNNARLRQGLESARRVQQAMLPAGPLQSPGLTIHWRFLASEELAGDLLQYYRLDDRHIGVWLLDVTGHGIGPALRAVSASQLLATRVRVASLVQSGDTLLPGEGPCLICPADVAAWLSTEFPWDSDLGLYFTLFYGVYDLETGVLRYVNAGHPAPVGTRADGTPLEIPHESGGMPIGLQRAPYQEQAVQLEPGDTILIYSDGASECVNADYEIFGCHRLQDFLNRLVNTPPDRALDDLIGELSRWCGGRAFTDDVSLLLMRRTSLTAPEFTI